MACKGTILLYSHAVSNSGNVGYSGEFLDYAQRGVSRVVLSLTVRVTKSRRKVWEGRVAHDVQRRKS